jgi:hypothetical protein
METWRERRVRPEERVPAIGLILVGGFREVGRIRWVGRIWQSLPAGAGLFFFGAALFIVGAINAAWHGLHEMMQLGLLGAAAAIGIAYVFCD